MKNEKQNKTLTYNIVVYTKDYLKNQRKLSANTSVTYGFAFMKFVKFLKSKKINIDTFSITNIDDELISQYMVFLEEENNCNRTINNRISVMKSFVEYTATKYPEMLENNRKIQKIKKLKEEVKVHEYLTPEEVHLLIKESKENLKYQTMLSLLYDCALRVSELINIKVEDINLRGNNSTLIIENGKGNKSRNIPLSKQMTKILKKYLREYDVENYLFENKYKTTYNRRGVTYILERYYHLAKIKCKDNTMFKLKPYCHLLRHSKGVHMVDAGISLYEIKEYFGHSSISTTEIYARSSTKHMKEILENSTLNKKIATKRSEKEKTELERFLQNLVK